MGRNAGIALWCGIANGAEDILLPERYDGNEQALILTGSSKTAKRGKSITSSSTQRASDIPLRWPAALRQLPALRPEPPFWATCSEAALRPVRIGIVRVHHGRKGQRELLCEGKEQPSGSLQAWWSLLISTFREALQMEEGHL